MIKNHKIIQKSAFTLAEVLITLGVIGVVAALTLPTLIQNHRKQTYVAGLKKAYSTISNAFSKMAVDEGITDWKQLSCYSLWYAYGTVPLDAKESCVEGLKKQLKVISTKPFEVTSSNQSYGSLVSFVTVDGMVYTLRYSSSDGASSPLYGCSIGMVCIDVDVYGEKGPNKVGRDKFRFYINYGKNKIVPDGADYPVYCTTVAVNKGWSDAYNCAGKVLIEGKMNY